MGTSGKIHVIGAGMAGLSAALQLSMMGKKVDLYEAAPYAGGRCRSYFDRGLDCRIDNGNHLVMTGNVAVNDYLQLTQAIDGMHVTDEPIYPFMDLSNGERWAFKPGNGKIPWWIFKPNKRIPGTKAGDYMTAFNLLKANSQNTVASLFNTEKAVYRRFWEPLAIAALNTEPELASAKLFSTVFFQSFFRGGKEFIPMLPKIGLSESFVMPCLNTIRQRDADIKFGYRLRSITTDNFVVKCLNFGEETVEVEKDDWVVLAVPSWVAQELIPGLTAPDEYRSIANVHFRVEAPSNLPGFTGLVGGLAEWAFVKQGVVSVTISAADRYDGTAQDALPVRVWRDLAKLFDLDPMKLPPWRVVREKRATFAATPEQNFLRPPSYIGWKNLALAGDWTATGLPSTIEGAIRSGIKAAQVIIRWEK